MTTPSTFDEAASLAICEAATPGPWRNGADQSHFDAPEVTDDRTFAYYVRHDADAAFVAHARAALPAALARIEELRRLLLEACDIATTVDARPELRDDGFEEYDHRGRARLRLRIAAIRAASEGK